MRILLVNDDGISAPGLETLSRHLVESGHEIFIYAPENPASATSHSISVYHSLNLKEYPIAGAIQSYSVNGFPADCVKVALYGPFAAKNVDLIISGINRGINGGIDTFYSGTVAGAREGFFNGLPSIAVSVLLEDRETEPDYESAAQFIASFIGKISVEEGLFLNINVPNLPYDQIKGAKITRISTLPYKESYILSDDKETLVRAYGQRGRYGEDSGDDISALDKEYISITPLIVDVTDYSKMDHYKQLLAELPNKQR